MTFRKLADYFSQLEATSSRLEITRILAEVFKQAAVQEIPQICYLSLGRLAPLYAGIEFNLAEKLMLRVLALAYQKPEAEIRQKFKQLGDLGDTAAFFDQTEKPKPLAIKQVYEQLLAIAQDGGEGSVERKIKAMAGLLIDLDGNSAKYVVRVPLGRLRMGFSEATILDALSWLLGGDKSKRAEIEAAFNLQADIGQIAQLVKQKGLRGLQGIKVQLGVPVMPALSQRLPTAKEMIEKMGPNKRDKVAVEPKFDGTRLQLHFSRTKKGQTKSDQLDLGFRPQGYARTFTRNLEDTTTMFPDLIEAAFKEIKAEEAILDCEAIGVDPKTGKFLPFQETIQRKRKYAISQKAKEIPLKLFCFDLLYYNGRDLISQPFEKRRKLLEKVIPKTNQTVLLTPQLLTRKAQKLRQYHDQQIEKGLEGVMVKKWQAHYDPGRRGYTWVKLKSEKGKKGAGLADTLDCVVMGYYKGRGKRTKFGVGAFLVGIRKKETYLTISKIGTGLTDEQWQELFARCQKVKTRAKPKQYQMDKNLTPDVWCNPQIVVEIEADNITKSPIHTAKLAFRFPRLIRFRDDKDPAQSSTLAEAKKLFQLQR